LSQLLTACATATTVLPPPVPERERQLQAGDVLRIEVWRQPEYSGEFEIGADGALVHPLYQEVQLRGMSERSARESIAEFLAGYLQNVRLVVEPLYSVSVAGEVRQPSVYQTPRGTTIAEAVAIAGGPTNRAHLNQILLVRSGTEYPLRLGEGLATFASIPLVSGDQLFVEQQRDFNIWRDVVGPIATLASLTLAIVRITDETAN
jgi:polysaccharide export outer membrane protein